MFGGQVIGQALVAACRTVEGRRAFHARLFPSGRRSESADHLRGRAHARRQKLHHAQRESDPARPADLHHVGVVPQQRGRPRPSGSRCRTCRRRKSCRAKPRCASASCRRCRSRCAAITSANGRSNCARSNSSAISASKSEDGRFNVWIRTTGRLPDDPAIHQCVLAYASDMTLLDTALVPHGRTLFEKDFMAREPRPCALAAPAVPRRRMAAVFAGQRPTCTAARGFARGLIFTPRRHPGRLGGAGGPDPRLRPLKAFVNTGAARRARLLRSVNFHLMSSSQTISALRTLRRGGSEQHS